MEELKKIIIIGLISSIISLVLKKESPVFSLMVSIISGIMIFFVILNSLENVVSIVKDIFLKTNLQSDIVNTVFKICGIGILSEYF